MKRVISLGFALVSLAMVGFGGRVVAQQGQSRDECSLPQKGRFSIGWVADEGGKHYRCLPVFDGNLRPAGAAWIEVVRENRFVIKD